LKGQGKLNRYVIIESVPMLFAENYQNWSVPVETTASQSWRIFWVSVVCYNV